MQSAAPLLWEGAPDAPPEADLKQALGTTWLRSASLAVLGPTPRMQSHKGATARTVTPTGADTTRPSARCQHGEHESQPHQHGESASLLHPQGREFAFDVFSPHVAHVARDLFAFRVEEDLGRHGGNAIPLAQVGVLI